MWQKNAIDRLSSLLREESGVKAVILVGSLASSTVQPDEWSDVDLKVIVADRELGRFYPSVSWLAPLGGVFAVDYIEHGSTKTIRICLDDFQRFDITFIPESSLAQARSWDDNPFAGEYEILWSRIGDLDKLLAAIPPSPPFEDTSATELDEIANRFWLKATVTVVKVMRNDLLVALHLALDLARDCLLLQMMLRDREKGTNVHREGGYGNDIVKELCTSGQEYAPCEILDVIETSCVQFDRLAAQVSHDYRQRSCPMVRWIRKARQELAARSPNADRGES